MEGIKAYQSFQDGQLRQEAETDQEGWDRRILKMTGRAGMALDEREALKETPVFLKFSGEYSVL